MLQFWTIAAVWNIVLDVQRQRLAAVIRIISLVICCISNETNWNKSTSYHCFLWTIRDSWRREWINATRFVNFWKFGGGFRTPKNPHSYGPEPELKSFRLVKMCVGYNKIWNNLKQILVFWFSMFVTYATVNLFLAFVVILSLYI